MSFEHHPLSCVGIPFIFASILLTGCNDATTRTIEEPNGSAAVKVDLSPLHASSEAMLSMTPLTASSTASISNYGVHTPTDFYLNADGSVDIFWQSDNAWHLSRFTSEKDASLLGEVTLPTSINQAGRYLGFSKNELTDTYYLAYSKDNQYASRDTEGKCLDTPAGQHYNCNAAYWLSGFKPDGSSVFDTLLFGDADLGLEDIDGGSTKGNPGQAAVGIVKYLPSQDRVVLYTGHLQRWSDKIRHQAGWVGSVAADGSASTTHAGWFSSHNFDQRLAISPDDKVYGLAHGDAFPRALQLTQWDFSQPSADVYTHQYHAIENGSTGDNKTLADTGDIAVLNDDLVAIAFATQDSRASRDVRLQLLSGVKENTISEQTTVDIWLTEYDDTLTAGKGIKVARAGDDKVLVAWNTYQGENPEQGTKHGDYINTTIEIRNSAGELLADMMLEDRLMPTQSIQVTQDGTTAVWVTTSDTDDTIMIHSLDLTGL